MDGGTSGQIRGNLQRGAVNKGSEATAETRRLLFFEENTLFLAES
jgi:hypothetical protein